MTIFPTNRIRGESAALGCGLTAPSRTFARKARPYDQKGSIMAGEIVYSSLKAFQFADRLQQMGDGQIPAPIHVRIKPTNTCNHDCWYCAYRTGDLELGEDMVEADSIPETKMFEIVDDVVEMGVKAVTFSGGGEPLLYKPLPEVIRRLGAAGIKLGCLSNGSNLQGKFADAIAEHVTWIRISIDAWDDESYTKSRGAKPGSFTKLLQNMRDFDARGSDCVVGVSLIIGKDNHDHVYDLCREFKNLGVKHVKLSAAVVSNNVAENNAYHEPFMESVLSEAKRATELESDNFKVVNHFHALSDRFDKPYSRCPSLKVMTVIGGDQNVYTCQDKAYTDGGLLGSIQDQSFKSFWYSQQNIERVENLDPRRDCKHHCMSHAKNTVLWEYMNLHPEHISFI
jgi:MoaA/NifB/PqqE/SkfB family radical SAM enzyme